MNLQSVKQLAILGVASLVISCGGGDGAVPVKAKPIPKGGIEGVVMLGPVIDATITVYKINPVDGSINKEKPIGKDNKSTNSSGFYSLEVPISVSELPILVCATGGRYTEPASAPNNFKADKVFGRTDELCAVTIYKKVDAEAKKKTKVNITFFTHLAYGLMKSKLAHAEPNVLMDKPATKTKAIEIGVLNQANIDVAAWLGIDSIVEIEPAEINNPSNGDKTLTPESAYGLANMGVSSTVDWLVTKKGVDQTFEGVSSIAFAQKAHEDIKHEKSQLDGRGPSGAVTLKSVLLDAHIYRHHMSARMMAAIMNTDINKTRLTLDAVKTFVNQIANHRETVFDRGAATQTTKCDEEPCFTHESGTLDVATLLSEKVTMGVSIIDISGIQSALLTVYSTVPGPVGSKIRIRGPATSIQDFKPLPQDANKALFVWEINTNAVDDGAYEIGIVAVSNRGVKVDFPVKGIKIANNSIKVLIVFPEAPLGDSNNPFNAFFSTAHISAQIRDGFKGTDVIFDLIEVTGLNEATSLPKEILAAKAVYTIPTPPITLGAGTPLQTYEYDALTVKSLPEGEFFLRIKATQNVPGVLKPDQKFDVKIRKFAVDTQNPTITYATGSPANDSVFPAIDMTISAIVSDIKKPNQPSTFKSGVVAASAHIGTGLSQGKVSAAGGPGGEITNATITVQLPENKWSRVQLGATDAAGNHQHTLTSRDYAHDGIPPVVTVKSVTPPNANSKWVKSLTVNVDVTDAIGIDNIAYTIGAGGAPQKVKKGSITYTQKQLITVPYSFTYTPPTGTLTPTDFFVVAQDGNLTNGQKSQLVGTKVGFDSTPPVIAFTAPAGANPTTPVSAVMPPATIPNFKVGMQIAEQGANLSSSGISSITLKPTAGTDIQGNTTFAIAAVDSNTATNSYAASMPTVKSAVHEIVAREQHDYDVTSHCSITDITASSNTALVTGFSPLPNAHPTAPNLNLPVNGFNTIPETKLNGTILVEGYTAPTLATTIPTCFNSIKYTTAANIGANTTVGGVNIIASTIYTYYYPAPTTARLYTWTAKSGTGGNPNSWKYYFVKSVVGPTVPTGTTGSPYTAVTKLDITAKDNVIDAKGPNVSKKTWCMNTTVTAKALGTTTYKKGAIPFPKAPNGTAVPDVQYAYMSKQGSWLPLSAASNKPTTANCWTANTVVSNPTPALTGSNVVANSISKPCAIYGGVKTISVMETPTVKTGSGIINEYSILYTSNNATAVTPAPAFGTCP